MVNDKTKGECNTICMVQTISTNSSLSVDENLFYKGVDKSSVHGARLSQTHSLSDPTNVSEEQQRHHEADARSPPYPFSVGGVALSPK